MESSSGSTLSALLRWREPAAYVLLVALAVRILVGLVATVFLAGDVRYDSFALAALFEGASIADPVLVLALAAAAVGCLLGEQTANARTVVMLAALVSAVAVGLSVLFAFVGLVAGQDGSVLDVLGVLTLLVPSAVAVGGLILAVRGVPDQRSAVSAPAAAGSPYPTAGQPPAQALPRQGWQGSDQPTWQGDQATGAAWHTAGAAATGAPASNWDPGISGWQPIPQQPGSVGLGGQPISGPPRPDWSPNRPQDAPPALGDRPYFGDRQQDPD